MYLKPHPLVCAVLLAFLYTGDTADSSTVLKANNTTNLVMGGSWVGGNVPAGDATATWDSTVAGANTVVLGANLSVGQIAVSNPGGAVTINDDGNTLGLNAPSGIGIDMSTSTRNLALKCPVALRSSQTWDIGVNRTLTLNGVISGSFKLTKVGDGTLFVTANNTYTGGTDIAAGTVKVGGNYNYAFGPSGMSVAIRDGATLDLNGTPLGVGWGNYVIAVGGTGVGGNGAIINTYDFDAYVGKLSLSSDTTFGGTKYWEVYNPNGTLNGNGFSLTKVGSNEVALDGMYGNLLTVSGIKDINVNAGILSVIRQTTINNSQPGSIYIKTGGILSIGSYGYTLTIQKPLVMSGGILQTDTSGSNGNATIATGVVLNATGYFSPQGSVLTLNGSVSDGTTSNGIVVSSATPGTLVLGSSTNTYSGDTIITKGTLRVGTDAAIPSGTGKGNVIVGSDGILDLCGHTVAVNGLTGTGIVFNTSATTAWLSVGNNDGGSSFDGSIQNGIGCVCLIKNGVGTLNVTGANSYTGNTVIHAGKLDVTQGVNDGGSAKPVGNTSVAAGAELESKNLRQAGVMLDGKATITANAMPPGNPGRLTALADTVSVIRSALIINGTGLLNLQDNDLILKAGAGQTEDSIKTLIASGYNTTQDWTGTTGLTSSTAAANPTYFALGYGLVSRTLGDTATTFDEQPVAQDDLIVKYTYKADLNLDGLVNGNDVIAFAAGYGKGSNWTDGNITYHDGVSNGNDVIAFAAAYNSTLGAVPEPSVLVLLALSSVGLLVFCGRRI